MIPPQNLKRTGLLCKILCSASKLLSDFIWILLSLYLLQILFINFSLLFIEQPYARKWAPLEI